VFLAQPSMIPAASARSGPEASLGYWQHTIVTLPVVVASPVGDEGVATLHLPATTVYSPMMWVGRFPPPRSKGMQPAVISGYSKGFKGASQSNSPFITSVPVQLPPETLPQLHIEQPRPSW